MMMTRQQQACNACVLGLASTCYLTFKPIYGCSSFRFYYSGGFSCESRRGLRSVCNLQQSSSSSSSSSFGDENNNGFLSFGPSLQRGQKVQGGSEFLHPLHEDGRGVFASKSEMVEGAGNSGRRGGEISALDKLHEAWEKGTWGGEPLTKWAKRKLELGVGWRVKAALAEYDAWARSVEHKEAIFKESNLVNAKELTEKLVKEDGHFKKFLKGADLDRESFTRMYNLAALQVPADDCGMFVSKLKGHLLNWPRVKNVARVEGDDGDSAMKPLLWDANQVLGAPGSVADSVRAAVYSENPAVNPQNMGNARKKRRFKTLDKLTRGADSALVEILTSRRNEPTPRPPKRGSRRNSWEEGAVTVEVVGPMEGGSNANNGTESHELERWRDATRLLLLDESYADKLVDELPQAVQRVLQNQGCELLQCRLTLAYDYWPMDEILREVLPVGMTIPSAYESVGHIAHLNLRNEHLPYRHTIAQIILEKNKPRIRTVVNKTDTIHNKYRTMQLELLAGNSSLITTVVEHGLYFRVDLASVYWNSRLATERQRLIDSFDENDIVCDMFAGVGPITVVAAKKVKCVYANDLNPIACTYMQHNLIKNKLAHKAEVSNMDGRIFVQGLLARKPPIFISQVVMNLPLDAAEFLDVFVHTFPRKIWERQALPEIHVYGFSKAVNPEGEYSERKRLWISDAGDAILMLCMADNACTESRRYSRGDATSYSYSPCETRGSWEVDAMRLLPPSCISGILQEVINTRV